MSEESYRNVTIGSGEGGKYLAWHLAQAGEQTMRPQDTRGVSVARIFNIGGLRYPQSSWTG